MRDQTYAVVHNGTILTPQDKIENGVGVVQSSQIVGVGRGWPTLPPRPGPNGGGHTRPSWTY